jgi:urease accessory protein
MVLSSAAEPGEPVVRRLSPRRLASAEPRLERVRGAARVAFAASDGRTRLGDLVQSGSAKIRLPRTHVGTPPEAVFLNTAGGVTGGDELEYMAEVADGAAAIVTTQAAERIYRRFRGVGRIVNTIKVGAGARLDWLPQETILFDRSALSRTITADLAVDAMLLAIEAIVLGRAAMGEVVREAHLRDSWRIRRGGRLIFADALRIDGDAAAILSGRATGGGASAIATLLLVAPDAESRLDEVRAALDGAPCESGISAWNGMLVARFVAGDGQALRGGIVPLIETLRGRPMPRVWNC